MPCINSPEATAGTKASEQSWDVRENTGALLPGLPV